ncbi:class I SAM-dependent methyltransferase [Prosthecobacter sp.]|uniref:class I SAM-dependent methyltransferase n=1 Tax=Prosthecobacter sp. TaxID=1965333 RepID=UPI00378492EB
MSSGTLQRLRNKAGYLLSSAAKHLSGGHRNCPSCGSAPAEQLDQKWLVTTFCRCSRCRLLYRIPTSDARENETFYQEDYTEGFTTDLPSAAEIQHLIATQFAGSEKNYAHYLAVLRALRISPGARLFDYGCSWGYGSHQLAAAGYQVDSFEISRPRAAYARTQLGVSMPALDSLQSASYDVFFSAHVIEHVPSPAAMIALGMRLLKPGGLFVCFCPNGSLTFRQRAPRDWHLMWGQSHPQLLDEVFLKHTFPQQPLLLHSAPLLHWNDPVHLKAVTAWQQKPGVSVGGLDHVEMLFATVKDDVPH